MRFLLIHTVFILAAVPCAAAQAQQPAGRLDALKSLSLEELASLDVTTAARRLQSVADYVRTRDWESRCYEKAVSDWELARYFEII